MFILIKTEIMKLKRSYMFLLCIAGSICAPLLNWFVYLNNEQNTGVKPTFYDYMTQTNLFIAIIIGTLLYSLFTTYIFEREFTENMYKHLFTVPISKLNFLISKIIITMLGILFLTMTSYVFGLIFSLISGYTNINSSSLVDTITLYLRAYIVYIPLMIPVIFITLLFKGFVAPIAFSIVAEIALFIIMQSEYISYYPWSAPILIGTDLVETSFKGQMLGSVSYNIASVIIIGVIAFLASLIYLNKKEIV